MKAPDWFVEQLRLEFPHLRIRWSIQRQAFLIEQKVGPEAFVPFKVSEIDDDTIRARDGYAHVMEVRPGDRMPCRKCGFTLKVPHLKVAEVRCLYCQSKGRDSKVYAGFFPLNESLLEELRFGDPYRGGVERMMRMTKDSMVKYLAEEKKKVKDERGDAMFDALIHQIPKVGYTTSKVFEG